MTRRLFRATKGLCLILSLSVGLSACGGGQDAAPVDGHANNNASTSTAHAASPLAAPPATGAPTAALSTQATTAKALVAAVKAGALAAAKTQGAQSLPLAALFTAPSGAANTGTGPCPLAGTYSDNTAVAQPGYLSAGDILARSLFNCSYVTGSTLNGNVVLRITRAATPTEWALELSADGLRHTTENGTQGPVDWAAQIESTPHGLRYAFTVDGHTILGLPTLTATGSTATLGTGTLRTALGSGWVEVAYSGWVFNPRTGLPSAGTATVQAAPGHTATINVVDTAFGGKAYRVSLHVNGVLSTHTVAFA